MMRLSTMFSRLAFVVMAGFAIASCTEETTGPGTSTTTGHIQAEDSVGALSLSSTSIGVRWARTSHSGTVDTIIAMNGNTVAATATATGGATTAVLTGLTLGTQYTIMVNSNGYTSLHPVTWMTANRSGVVRIYETADNLAGHPSGLSLSTFEPLSVSTAANATKVDVVLGSYTSLPSGLSLVGAQVAGSGVANGRVTQFSNAIAVPGGLDNLYFTANLANQVSANTNAADLPTNAVGVPWVIITETADGNFAKIEIMPQANGQLYGGTPGHNYIDVRVSYQPVVNAAYASRPHPVKYGHDVPKVSLKY